jgi:L-asparaginase
MQATDPGSTRRVVVIGLGGTIAMTAADQQRGAVPTLSASQLLGAVPGLSGTGITVDAVDLRRRPGASLDFDDLAATEAAVAEQLDRGADGVVILQGTDTIEETAYLLDLGHHRPQPVVVTGAMRNPSLAGADGPANLLAAVRTAADPATRDLGVLVVFHDEIHAAARVRKTHTSDPATFGSPDGGPLGYVVEGRPQLLNRPVHRFVVPLTATTRRPLVAVFPMALGEDGTLLPAIADQVAGLVIAAFGAGHVPESTVPLLARMAERIPVVLASRTGAGSVLAETYGFPGSEQDLLARGLIRAGWLHPMKARILLLTLLTVTEDRGTLAAAFGAAGGYLPPTTWPWPLTSALSNPPRHS